MYNLFTIPPDRFDIPFEDLLSARYVRASHSVLHRNNYEDFYEGDLPIKYWSQFSSTIFSQYSYRDNFFAKFPEQTECNHIWKVDDFLQITERCLQCDEWRIIGFE